MELDEVADELYGLRPQEFTAARDERAREARAGGQRELAARIRDLRRPTMAAWASNLLVREQGEQVAPLLRLGEELRGAHRNLDGEELRALSHRQHQLVSALTRQAEQLAAAAGTSLGPQVQQEVAQTLHAVLADPDAGREWAQGRLSRPLTGTGGFDAAAREAAAAPAGARRGGTQPRKRAAAAKAGKGADVRGRKRPGQVAQGTRAAGESGEGAAARQAQEARQAREALREARQAAREAAAEARDRRSEADAASEEASAARSEHEDAEEQVERLRGELREAEEARKSARQREREAVRAEREAHRAAEAAEERAGKAEEAEKRARHNSEAQSGTSGRPARSGGTGRKR
ncbi:hypothetical protein [Streptomyces winkii]|uniref:hypothetical protein n=1 Tax=Streptomyces winkii TaxID=3051178 RepID=UPI0028D5EFBF|nr:hypothetical protein [Streptomyces sp. DSM 40971]